MAQLLGTVSIIVNGVKLDSRKGAKLKLGGAKRTPQMGTDGLSGFTEEPVSAEVDFTLNVGDGADLPTLNATRDSTLLFLGDNGVVHVVNQATCDGESTLSDGGDGISVKFFGEAATKG